MLRTHRIKATPQTAFETGRIVGNSLVSLLLVVSASSQDDNPHTVICIYASFWWDFHHWLHWKLSKWQLPVQASDENFVKMTFWYQCTAYALLERYQWIICIIYGSRGLCVNHGASVTTAVEYDQRISYDNMIHTGIQTLAIVREAPGSQKSCVRLFMKT